METTKQKIVKILFIIGVAIFLAISFWGVSYCTGDDAGTYMWVYRQYELGSMDHGLKAMIDPWNVTISLIYFLGLGDNGVDMAMGCFAVWYFLNVLVTLLIAMRDVQKNKWVLWLAAFMMIPWGWTNKCHEVVICFSLLILYSFYKWMKTRKKSYILCSAFLFLFSFIVLNDRVLILLFTLAPIVAYYILLCMQDKEKRKYMYIFGLLIVAAVVGMKIVDEMCRNLSGQGLTIMDTWGGYGGEDYLTWIDTYNLFDKGIPSFFQALFNQYNIPISGGMIQYNSFYWVIRILLVGLILSSFISRWKSIIKGGIVNVDAFDAIATIGVTIITCVNVMNGVAKDYGTDMTNYPLNRYASLVWFLLIIIFIRWVDEKYVSCSIIWGKEKITSGFVIGLALILLTVGYSKPIYKGREGLGTQPCISEINYLKEKGDVYKYGIASYWKANPITAVTSGEYVVCAGEIKNEAIACIGNHGNYSDGSNIYNYIISYVRNDAGMDEEGIEEIRGDYIEKTRVYSSSEQYTDNHGIFGEAGESIIYLYDYDIRWNPRLVMEAVGTDYELIDPIEYNFEFPVGTNRIEMEVTNSANFELEVLDSPDIQNVNVQKLEDNKIYVDIVCLQNTNVTFKVSRKADEMTTIHKIVLKRVRGAVTVYEDGQNKVSEVYLKSGSYVFTFAGENLNELEVNWSGENIVTEQLTDGKIRRRYCVEIKEPQTIQYIVSGDGVTIDKISYENAVLFEEE